MSREPWPVLTCGTEDDVWGPCRCDELRHDRAVPHWVYELAMERLRIRKVEWAAGKDPAARP